MISSGRLASYIRIFVGIVFVFSSIAKLLAIDAFEIYIYKTWLLKLDYAFLMARLIIASELFIGILLSTGVWQKWSIRISIGILGFFSIYILYLIYNKSNEHCHCFGDIKISNEISLAKNLVLILLLLVSNKGHYYHFPHKKLIITIGIILSLIPPLILFPPDTFLYKKYSHDVSYNKSYLVPLLEENLDLVEGKQMICFFSTGCEFCKLAAQKITVILEKTGRKDIVTIFFAGSGDTVKLQSSVERFFNENDVRFESYHFISPKTFLQITNGSMPLIILLENNMVVGQYAYRDLVENEIISHILGSGS